MSRLPSKCLRCGSPQLFTRRVNAGGSHGPSLLPGLGGFLRYAKFDVVICADCGRCELFADEEAKQKVVSSHNWRRLGDAK
jgi:hypothetical protein